MSPVNKNIEGDIVIARSNISITLTPDEVTALTKLVGPSPARLKHGWYIIHRSKLAAVMDDAAKLEEACSLSNLHKIQGSIYYLGAEPELTNRAGMNFKGHYFVGTNLRMQPCSPNVNLDWLLFKSTGPADYPIPGI